jgi:hypothetical protein
MIVMDFVAKGAYDKPELIISKIVILSRSELARRDL